MSRVSRMGQSDDTETFGAARVRHAGEDALLLEYDSAEQVTAAYRELGARPPKGVTELVPAARTILLVYGAPAPADRSDSAADPAGSRIARVAAPRKGTVVIPTVYDGPDLEEVARLSGLSPEQVIEAHTAPEYVVAFCGFAPGFAYLGGLDPRLRLPRRATPRTRVPVGSVAIADEYAGVYPRSSPGGWHLLGRTEVRLWSVDADPPALLTPGTRVRFGVAQ